MYFITHGKEEIYNVIFSVSLGRASFCLHLKASLE